MIRMRQLRSRRDDHLAVCLAGGGDRIHQIDEVVRGVLALARKCLVAAPFEGDVTPVGR